MSTIVDLPQAQLEGLAALCAREKISRAEAIRRAVHLSLERRRPAAADQAFGLWRGRKTDARKLVARWREAWGPK